MLHWNTLYALKNDWFVGHDVVTDQDLFVLTRVVCVYLPMPTFVGAFPGLCQFFFLCYTFVTYRNQTPDSKSAISGPLPVHKPPEGSISPSAQETPTFVVYS